MVEPGEVVDRSTRREVLALYGRATLVDSQSYRAWHQWGLSNYRYSTVRNLSLYLYLNH